MYFFQNHSHGLRGQSKIIIRKKAMDVFFIVFFYVHVRWCECVWGWICECDHAAVIRLQRSKLKEVGNSTGRKQGRDVWSCSTHTPRDLVYTHTTCARRQRERTLFNQVLHPERSMSELRYEPTHLSWWQTVASVPDRRFVFSILSVVRTQVLSTLWNVC